MPADAACDVSGVASSAAILEGGGADVGGGVAAAPHVARGPKHLPHVICSAKLALAGEHVQSATLKQTLCLPGSIPAAVLEKVLSSSWHCICQILPATSFIALTRLVGIKQAGRCCSITCSAQVYGLEGGGISTQEKLHGLGVKMPAA